MMPRRFDHRSLGIGHTKPSAVILAATDALLDDVGSRIASDLVGDLAADPVRGALLTYVESIDDLVVEVDPAAYRASLPEPEPEPELAPAPPRPVRTNRIAVIAPLASLAAAVALIGCIALANRSSSPINPSPPHDTAAVQSHALLRHADLLLTAAQRASSTNRKWLVKQAQADLTHAVTLLPLTPPTARPDLRQQIQSLRAEITTQQQPGTGSHQTRPSHSTGHTQQSNDPSGGSSSAPTPRSTTGGSAPNPRPTHEPTTRPTSAPHPQPTQHQQQPPGNGGQQHPPTGGHDGQDGPSNPRGGRPFPGSGQGTGQSQNQGEGQGMGQDYGLGTP